MTKLFIIANESEPTLENLPIPTSWVDENGKFLGANKRFMEIFKLSNEQILADRFYHYFDAKNFLHFLDQFMRENETNSEIKQSILVGNKIIHFKFHLQKYLTPSKKKMIAICAEDITPIIEINQEVDAFRNKSLQSSRMAILGEMTSGIAHEINNPLAIILALTDKLKQNIDQNQFSEREDSLKRLEKIINTSHRIDKIVKSLKMFARDGARDPFQSTSVAKLVNESLELCFEKLKNREIELLVDNIDPNLEIDCRSAQISQILLNLISNSKDAVEKLEEKWIKVQVKDLGDCVRFSVSDSGHGIPPEISSRLTESFFTTKEVGSGTGLGLSISKTIIDAHHGQLYVDNDCPNTKFVFDIPKGLSKAA